MMQYLLDQNYCVETKCSSKTWLAILVSLALMASSPILAMGVSDECKGPAKKCGGEDIKTKTIELMEAQDDLLETVTVFKPELLNERQEDALKRASVRAKDKLDRTTGKDFDGLSKKGKGRSTNEDENPDAEADTTDDEFDELYGAELIEGMDDLIAGINELEDEIVASSADFDRADSFGTLAAAADSTGFPHGDDYIENGTLLSKDGNGINRAIGVKALAQAAYDGFLLACGDTISAWCAGPVIVFNAIFAGLDIIINEHNDSTAREVTATYNGLKLTYDDLGQVRLNQELTGQREVEDYRVQAAVYCSITNVPDYRACVTSFRNQFPGASQADRLQLSSESESEPKTLRDRIESIKLSVVGPDPDPEDPEPAPPISIADLLTENKAKIEKLEAQQDRMEANQALIIELLKTPSGKRPGYND